MTTRKRSSDRKMARVMDTSHPGLPGRSLRDKIQDDLDEATQMYLVDKNAGQYRGIMRGLAKALAHISVDIEYRPTPLELEKATIRRLRDGG